MLLWVTDVTLLLSLRKDRLKARPLLRCGQCDQHADRTDVAEQKGLQNMQDFQIRRSVLGTKRPATLATAVEHLEVARDDRQKSAGRY